MFKKIAIILLSVLLVLSFTACGKTKDKDSDKTSSPDTSSVGDPTQDYNKDEFDESPMDNEELEDLWNDNFSDEDAEIITGNSKPSSGSTSGNSSSNSSSTTSGTTSGSSSSTGSSSNSGSSSSEVSSSGSSSDSAISGTSGSIGFVPDAIF